MLVEEKLIGIHAIWYFSWVALYKMNIKPYKLLVGPLLAISTIAGCSGSNNTEVPTNIERVQDLLPDRDGALGNVEHVLAKARLGKIKSAEFTEKGDFIKFRLKSGSTIFLYTPRDDAKLRELIDGLLQSPEPITIQVGSTEYTSDHVLGAFLIGVVATALIGGGLIKLADIKNERAAKKAHEEANKKIEIANAGTTKKEKQKPKSGEVTFKDVRGYPELVKRLKNILSFIKEPEKNKVGAPVPKGILLAGPSGTGKTFLAKALAGEAGIPLFAISGADIQTKWMAEGAENLRKLFSKAEANKPCILFIDEIDAFGYKRSDDTSSRGAVQDHIHTIDQFLTLMDGFHSLNGVTVLAATNRLPVLDEALLRPGRFDMIIEVPLPVTPKQREDILEKYIEEKRSIGVLEDNIDIKTIAEDTPGLSPAQLAGIVSRAAVVAQESGADKITQKHFDDAIEEVKSGIKSENIISENDRFKTAIYEIVGRGLTAKGCGIDLNRASMIPRGTSIGHVTLKPGVFSEVLPTKSELLKRLLIALGGIAAQTELLDENQFTVGGKDDLDKAREIIKILLSSGMVDGIFDADYTHTSGKISERDSKITNELIKKALLKARDVVKTVPKEKLLKIVKAVLNATDDLKGDEANNLFSEVDKNEWGQIQKIVKEFADTATVDLASEK